MYATSNDLLVHRKDIFDHGVTDWDDQLQLAENEVIERIKTEWFVSAVRSTYGYSTSSTYDLAQIVSMFDIARLDTTAIVNLIALRALAFYIYPSLTVDTDDGEDAFSRRAERYKAFYDGEWERVRLMPIYDFNNDTSFDDFDRVMNSSQLRVVRA